MARILLTGASGFIGSWLATELSREGHQLDLLLRKPGQLSQVQAFCEQHCGELGALHALPGDLSQAWFGWGQWPQQKQWDVIIHCGALFGWGLNYELAWQTNVQGSVRIVELAAQQHAQLFWLGGFMLHNQQHLQELNIQRCLQENNFKPLYRKVGVYEASKIEAHYRSVETAEKLGVAYNVLHPATLIGHSQLGELHQGQSIYQLGLQLKQQKLTAIPGSPRHVLPMVEIDVLVAVMRSLVREPLASGSQLVAVNDAGLNLAGCIKLLAEGMSVAAPQKFIPIWLLKRILQIPGVAALLGSDKESLAFIRPERPQFAPLQTFCKQRAIHLPDLTQSLRYLGAYIGRQTV